MRFGLKTKFLAIFAFLACMGLAGTPEALWAQATGVAASNNLASVLAGMDAAAAQFKTATGNLEYTKVTVVVDDHSTERGKIFFEKSKGKLRVMLAFEQPAQKYVLFNNGKVSIYRPKIAEVEEYSLANNQGLLEQFLLLGFGTSGADLQKAYQVSFQGEETLDGERTVHLELIPKSQQVLTRLARVELWLSPQTWQPVQQKFTEPSKDYLIARYRTVRQNTTLPSKTFQLPLQGKVRTVRH
jgi:outer membrane lipoprotein-sorting protein